MAEKIENVEVISNKPSLDAGDYNYAGFGKRLLARIIDGLLLSTVSVILVVGLFFIGVAANRVSLDSFIKGNEACRQQAPSDSVSQECKNFENSLLYPTLIFQAVITILSVSYYVFLTSSKMQGTLGKKLMGLKVVNKEYQKVSLVESFTREIFYSASSVLSVMVILSPFLNLFNGFLSLFILVDALIMFGNEKRATLHDRLAHTYVLNTKEEDLL